MAILLFLLVRWALPFPSLLAVALALLGLNVAQPSQQAAIPGAVVGSSIRAPRCQSAGGRSLSRARTWAPRRAPVGGAVSISNPLLNN